MKILRIISSGFAEGGAETGVMHIQPHLEARGYTIKILASNNRPDLPHFNDYTFRAPGAGWSKLLYTWNIFAYRRLRQALKDFKPDVVHLHTLGAASPAVLFALRNTPTVATVHGPEGYTRDLIWWCMPKENFKNGEYAKENFTFVGRWRYFYYRYINYPLYKLGFKHVDTIVTISTYIRDVMDAQGNASEYIPNGIQLFPHVPLPQEPSNIIFVGRLEKVKGLEYVIQALPAVVARFPKAHLTVVGEGGERGELEALAQKLGVREHVTFTGRLPHPQVLALYEQASVAVVPSIWPEVCSRSGIEALSVGRPVVATNMGGTPDWLHDGYNGRLVPPKDAHAIAAALIELMSEPHKLAEMGKHARKMSERYDIALHAERIDRVYKRLASRLDV